MPQPITPRFELPPSGIESGGETDVFDALLEAQQAMAADGGTSATDFVRDTLEEALQQGVDVTPQRLSSVLNSAFGRPEQLAGLLGELTQDKATDKYGDLLPILVEYAYPKPEE